MDEINGIIEYANSEPVNISVTSQYGNVYPSGEKKYKKTDEIKLQFYVKEGYQFLRWQVFDQNEKDVTSAGYIDFEDIEKNSVTAKVKKLPSSNVSLRIAPLCIERPTTLSTSPVYFPEGSFRDSRIEVVFDAAIDEGSIYYSQQEKAAIAAENAEISFMEFTDENGLLRTYGYIKPDGDIVYKNIKITDKKTGENLLKCYAQPKFESSDTFILRTKVGEDAPTAGKEVTVELSDFFCKYEKYDIKIGKSVKWIYLVNGNTDQEAPSIPDGYYINVFDYNSEGYSRIIEKDIAPSSNFIDLPYTHDELRQLHLKDKKLKVQALLYDGGSGLAANGFTAEYRKIYDDHYNQVPVTEKKTATLGLDIVRTNASCDAIVDFEKLKAEDGVYKIDFRAKDVNGNNVILKTSYVVLDSTPPDTLDTLFSLYSSKNKQVSAHWEKPNVLDYESVKISADYRYLNNTTSILNNKVSTEKSIAFSTENMNENTVFDITAKVVDIFGNESDETTVLQALKSTTSLKEIVLDRYHFAYDESNPRVTATAKFDSIDFVDDEELQFVVLLGDKTKAVNYAAYDPETGTAYATIKVPSINKPDDNGSNYVVKVRCNGEFVKDSKGNEVSARFNIGRSFTLSSFTLMNKSLKKVELDIDNVLENSKIKAIVTGYNLDLPNLYIQVYDSYGKTYYENPIPIDNSNIQWTATEGKNGIFTLETNIPVPATDDTYTVKLLEDDEALSKTTILYVYGKPRFTSFYIPPTTIYASGNLITGTITGKNFMRKDFDVNDITVSCTTSSPKLTSENVVISKVDDSTLYVTLPVSSRSGIHTVVVGYNGQTITSELNVRKTNYNVGDIVLSDGSVFEYRDDLRRITKADFTDANGVYHEPIAIIFSVDDQGRSLGVGVHTSYEFEPDFDDEDYDDYEEDDSEDFVFRWSEEDSTGYNTYFDKIVCYDEEPESEGVVDSIVVNGYPLYGDLNGSDNWEYICGVDYDGSRDAATNYPAFNWVKNYAKKFSLPETYSNGWYLPSIAELEMMYEAGDKIDYLKLKMDTAGILKYDNFYSAYYGQRAFWSSSQHPLDSSCAWVMYMEEDYVNDFFEDYEEGLLSERNSHFSDKSEFYGVCVVRVF